MHRCILTAVMGVLFSVLLHAAPVNAQETRTWTDQSGKFSIQATMVRQQDDKVVLRKSDGNEVSVPISMLSSGDQDFLKTMTTVNPFAGGTPGTGSSADGLLTNAGGAKELRPGGKQIYLKIDVALPAIEADPSPTETDFQSFVGLIEKLDFWAKASPPIVVDPASGKYAVSTTLMKDQRDQKKFGRLHLCSMDDTESKVVIDIDKSFKIFDHNVKSDRTLAVVDISESWDRGGDLVILEGLKTGSPKTIARYRVPGWNKPGNQPKINDAKWLDEKRGYASIDDTVYFWDLSAARPLAIIDSARGADKFRLSPGRKYLAIPKSRGCAILSTTDFKLLGTIPFEESILSPQVAFSHDGTRVALTAGSDYMVWDLTKAEIVSAKTLDTSVGNLVGWVDDRCFLTSTAGLIDIELGIPLWQYSLPSGDMSTTVPGGVVVTDKSDVAMAMGLPMPHDPVEQIRQLIETGGDSVYLIKPGTQVSIKVETIAAVNAKEIENALAKAVERAGWINTIGSPIVLTAKIGRGETKELEFRSFGMGFGTEKASIRPYTASLQVAQGKTPLWTRSTQNMVPHFLNMKKGETVQEAVRRYEKPNPEFFEELKLPPRVLSPEFKKNIGRSRVHQGRWRD